MRIRSLKQAQFNNVADIGIIIGTFNRIDLLKDSLLSLRENLGIEYAKVIVVSASTEADEERDLCRRLGFEYLLLPGTCSMAVARNVGFAYLKDRYVSEWVCFAEDDVYYQASWIQEILNRSRSLLGKQSPFGLAYGYFSATPLHKGGSDNVRWDEENQCYASFFGLRADQRVFRSDMYQNIARNWDPDLLGISSCQTGKQNHRMTMNGFVGGNFSGLQLCYSLQQDDSTWEGLRDIGPAAFDKRPDGYKSIKLAATQLFNNRDKIESKSQSVVIPPQTRAPMTSVGFDSIFVRARRKAVRLLTSLRK